MPKMLQRKKQWQRRVCGGMEAQASVVRFVGMLVTSFFSKSHVAYFFRVDFYCNIKCIQFLFALEARGNMQQISV